MAKKKIFTMLENNPDVMNHLAYQLGVSEDLAFHDVYSLHDPHLLALIPRPVYALLVIIPMTASWNLQRTAEDGPKGFYTGSGPDEPVIWFKQTIGHACGGIGLLHCVMNGHPATMIKPGSDLEKLLKEAIPLTMANRADLLADSDAFELAHQAAALKGDTEPPQGEEADKLGQHFVAFVKGRDGHLWELEGSRKGPLDRGLLGEDEDALSERALALGLQKMMDLENAAGGRFEIQLHRVGA